MGKALNSLKTGKAYMPVGIHPTILKDFARELAPALCHLFCPNLNTGSYASFWKYTLVQPNPKNGDPSDPSVYKPIALSSAIAKVFKSLLNSHFFHHLEKNTLLSDHQYGFRKARSQLLIFYHISLMSGHPP